MIELSSVVATVDPQDVPRLLVLLAASLTHLGNPLLAVGVTATLYWIDPKTIPRVALDRRRAVSLLAILLCAVAVVEIGKGSIAASRPPHAGAAGAVLDLPASVAGLSEESLEREMDAFPSGHVVTATVLWGGIAVLSDDRSWVEYVAAALVVVLVAGSRVLLGVHYPIDIAGAILLGGLLVAVLYADRRSGATSGHLFGLVVVVALIGLLLEGEGVETIVISGAMLGCAITWYCVGAKALDAASGWRPAGIGSVGVAVFWVVAETSAVTGISFTAAVIAISWLLISPVVVSLSSRRHASISSTNK